MRTVYHRLFFQNIKGYPDGYRKLGTPLGKHRRLAIAMGMAADTPPRILNRGRDA